MLSNRSWCRYGLAVLCCWWPLAALALPQVEPLELPDIQSALLSEDHTVPVIEMQLFFEGAGLTSDSEALQGRAELASRLLLEGAGEMDASAFQRALEAKAIELSTHAARDGLLIQLTTLAEHQRDAFALLKTMLTQPRFDRPAIARVKRVMQSMRRRQQESPYYLAQRALLDQAYPTHPYAWRLMGTEETLPRIDRAALMRYHRQWIARPHLRIALAGAIDKDDAEEALQALVEALPMPEEQAAPVPPARWPEKPFTGSVEKALPQTMLLFARDGIDRQDERFYAAYLLNYILGGSSSLTSRLGSEVRKKRGLTYGIGTDLYTSDHSNRWQGMMATQNATAAEAKTAILEVLGQTAKEGVRAEELQAAISAVTGAFPLKLDNNAAIASYLMLMQREGLGMDYFSNRNAYFRSVSLDTVNQLARSYLLPEQWSWIRVGPKPDEPDGTANQSQNLKE